MLDLQRLCILIIALTPRPAVPSVYAELSLAFRTAQTPGAFYLPQLLLTDARAGTHGGAKPRDSNRQPGHRTLFQDQVLDSVSCSEEQLFTCLSWCQQGGDHRGEQITARATAAGDISPLWAWATPAQQGAASRELQMEMDLGSLQC